MLFAHLISIARTFLSGSTMHPEVGIEASGVDLSCAFKTCVLDTLLSHLAAFLLAPLSISSTHACVVFS